MKNKKRLDVLLTERGLAPSRERAQSLILSGNVLVNDTPATKAGMSVDDAVEVRVRGEDHPYVSRGGLKLAGALDSFGIAVEGRVALDIGASTGGFTDVLLKRGAKRVFAIDVGTNQLAWSIRQDRRVDVREKFNARELKPKDLGQPVDLIVVDVSFISLDKIFPVMPAVMAPGADVVTLIKPQFEAGRDKVGKGGIVRSEEVHREVLEKVLAAAEGVGLERRGLIDSPITGTDGNKEYLAHWQRPSSSAK